MRISDWSSDVCSSDLRKCTGVTIVAAMMRVQCRTTTGVQAAARHRRADEQGKQPEDSASARKHCLTACQSPDAVQQQIKTKINALSDSFRIEGHALPLDVQLFTQPHTSHTKAAK